MIDFNKIDHTTPQALKADIIKTLHTKAGFHDIRLSHDSIPINFGTFTIELAKKYDRNVVVLIDEYDKAIISHIGKGREEIKIAEKNRDVLKQLFGVLKAQDVAGALRFVFLTGVSKFSQVSIFSDLNNLEDLSMRMDYCDLAGYTESELYQYFDEYIEELSNTLSLDTSECRKKLRFWYNGYQFTERQVKVYNPFSILSLFKVKQFKNYWFETGTPSFLVQLIKKKF